jgi:hypothetical protein
MARHNHFLIRNDLPDMVTLNIEPEGALVSLRPGEEVSVTDVFTDSPVTVKLTRTSKGDPVLSIWPGDGDVRVEKGGVDVFRLLQDRVGA